MAKQIKRGSPWIVPPCDSARREREQLERGLGRMKASMAAVKKHQSKPRKGK